MAVGLLRQFLISEFSQSELPAELRAPVLFDDVDFVTNQKLKSVLAANSATPEQMQVSIALNEDARVNALRASFLIVAGISLLAIFLGRKIAEVGRG